MDGGLVFMFLLFFLGTVISCGAEADIKKAEEVSKEYYSNQNCLNNIMDYSSFKKLNKEERKSVINKNCGE